MVPVRKVMKIIAASPHLHLNQYLCESVLQYNSQEIQYVRLFNPNHFTFKLW